MKKEVVEVFQSLVNNDEIIKLNRDISLYKETLEEAINLIKDYLNKNAYITIAG